MNIPIFQARTPFTWKLTVKDNGVAKDISAFVTLAIKVLAPSGTVTELTPTFLTTGTNGKLTYTVTSSIFTESGMWHYQVVLDEVRSNVNRFYVEGNI